MTYRRTSRVAAIAAISSLTIWLSPSSANEICEDETKALALFADIAGLHDGQFQPSTADIKSIEFDIGTEKLNGFRINANRNNQSHESSDKAVLVIQGNGMLAEHIVDDLVDIASANFDVYIFDFRGFGSPIDESNLNLRNIISDYDVILESLLTRYDEVSAYGISAGGFVLLNLKDIGKLGKIVLDAVPGSVNGSPRVRLFWLIPLPGRMFYDLQCPRDYQPIARLPLKAMNILIMHGKKDKVISVKKALNIHQLVRDRGGVAIIEKKWHHPFRDKAEVAHTRMKTAVDFLSGSKPST